MGWLREKSIVFSYDRGGFLAHSREFDPADLDVDMSGKVCLVTGANSGIGLATSRELARRGADVVLLCRNAGRGEEAREAIHKDTGNRKVRLEVVDLSLKRSVREIAEGLAVDRVDVLVHNAGVMPAERTMTDEGLELTLATNLVGPFLLTHLLMPRLRAARGARVVFVSSGGMYTQRLDIDYLFATGGGYSALKAYAQTKRAMVIVSEMLSARHADEGVTFNSMHPGWADTPAVRTSMPRFYRLTRKRLRTPGQGADTVVWLAVSPRVAGRSGLFWFDREAHPTHKRKATRESEEDRTRLWNACLRAADLPNGGGSA